MNDQYMLVDLFLNIINICFYILLIVLYLIFNVFFNFFNNMLFQDNFFRQREREGILFFDNFIFSFMFVDLVLNDLFVILYVVFFQMLLLFFILVDVSDLQGIEKVGLELSEKVQGKQ